MSKQSTVRQGEELRAAFKESYDSLNAAQKDAVDTIEGPVMVIAGPGTGKTQILTLRIANILLQTDTAPESILALTFTESGAKAMRERLRRYIGSRAYRVPIYTFHGFCGSLIKEYPDAYQTIIGGTVATELDKIHILETILDNPDFKLLRPAGNPAYYIPHLLRMIGTLKQEYITPDRLRELIATQEEELQGIERIHQKGAHKGKVRGEYTKHEAVIAKNKELLLVYQAYQALLQTERKYDFDDMIGSTIEALRKNQDMLRDLQEQYQYVLADEHQDVNGSQNRILELLTSYHQSPNIFVVGDEKQAIYRFQGASLENFLYFEDIYQGTKTIALTENYRSGQTILDAAHSLVAVEDGPLKDLRVPLQAAAVNDSSVSYRQYSHVAVEESDLVSSIKQELAAGTPAEEIAVIVRTNREVESITALLRQVGVKVSATADGDILGHPITIALEQLLKAVVTPQDESALFTVLHGPYWGISTTDVMKVLSAQTYQRSLTAILTSPETLAELDLDTRESVERVTQVLEEARRRLVVESPQQVLAYLVSESGFLTHVEETDTSESTRVLRRLYDEIERLVVEDNKRTLRDVLQALATYRAHNVPLTAPYITNRQSAVQVMTAHKSKGLEFTAVYIPHCTDSSWGGKVGRAYFTVPITRHQHDEYDALDDERRLFYVALTRAKQRVYISSADKDSAGKELLQSRLYEAIDPTYIELVSTDEIEATFSPTASIAPVAHDLLDPEMLRTVLTERGFSATSFNNYLSSPWNYIYRNVLRIPEVQPTHMLFGTAMHGVLETVTRQHSLGTQEFSASTLADLLQQQLEKLPVSVEEYTRLHEKGLSALTVYVPQLISQLPRQTKEELKVRVLLETGLSELPELPLTGMFDRLDFAEDGSLKQVVDYKTGKAKTRNVIEGKTASSDGGYKRQLVFYALLLELYDDERYQTRNTLLSFVEPDSKGVVKEESFTITDAEIEILKTEIIEATKAIMSGECLTVPCDPEQSSYCHLVEQLQNR